MHIVKSKKVLASKTKKIKTSDFHYYLSNNVLSEFYVLSDLHLCIYTQRCICFFY